MGLIISEKDEIIMSLVHYFITEENYTPIVVKGVKDEIWLENMDGPYKVVRINSNHIHNHEQLEYDILKTKGVLKQIKKKTFSFSVNVLNIFLDIDALPENNIKNMDNIYIDSLKSVPKNKVLTSAFKRIKTNLSTEQIDLEQIIKQTEDVNIKTQKKNQIYEDIFKPKSPIITNIIILTCILYFILMLFGTKGNLSAANLLNYGANFQPYVKDGEWYRLFSCIFVHASIIHLFLNMYALKIIGSQIESFLGKSRYIIVFIISGLIGSLFSAILTKSVSVGASGAIFGALGSLLYFTYHYRIVLGNNLKYEIMPIVIFNLFIGLMIPGVDVWAHIGGLIGGIFTTMAVGVPGKINKRSMINGTICTALLLGFLSYILFYYI